MTEIPYPAFRSCRLIFVDDTTQEASQRTKEQFQKCLGCRHFEDFYQDYLCKHPQGRECAEGRADHSEAK